MNPQDPGYGYGYGQQSGSGGYGSYGEYGNSGGYGQQPGSGGYGQQPNYPGQPAYPQQPNYPGQPGYAPPTTPLPGYGAPGQPSFSPYGPGYPGGAGYPPPQPPRRSNLGLILGIIGGVVVVAIIACIGFFALVGFFGSSTANNNGTPTVNSTATTAPTSTPSVQVIYQDSLTDSPSGWANDPARCFDGSDGYHIKAGHVCYAPAGTSIGDGTYSVTATNLVTTNSTTIGLAFHVDTTGDFYAFEISASGQWAFEKYTVQNNVAVGTALTSFAANSAIQTGANATNKLKVVAQGSSFTFFVNDTQVGQGNDASFASGACGLLANDPSSTSEIVFTNFEVTNP